MTGTEEGQNNPPVISISFQLCRAGRPPFTPRSLHLTASSEQTNSPGMCSSLHVLCALCHLGAGSSTTVPAVRTHSSGFLLLLGVCELALSTVKVFAGDVSDCAAPQQSQMLCTENTKAGKMCLSPSPRTPLCEELAQPPAEPPPGFFAHTAQSPDEFESIQPPGSAQPASLCSRCQQGR